jgi:hypothetical protein
MEALGIFAAAVLLFWTCRQICEEAAQAGSSAASPSSASSPR